MTSRATNASIAADAFSSHSEAPTARLCFPRGGYVRLSPEALGDILCMLAGSRPEPEIIEGQFTEQR